MNVKSRQYSGRSSSSARASEPLSQRFFHALGPAQTSRASSDRSAIDRVESDEKREAYLRRWPERRGLMRSVKYERARNWPRGKVSSREGW